MSAAGPLGVTGVGAANEGLFNGPVLLRPTVPGTEVWPVGRRVWGGGDGGGGGVVVGVIGRTILRINTGPVRRALSPPTSSVIIVRRPCILPVIIIFFSY